MLWMPVGSVVAPWISAGEEKEKSLLLRKSMAVFIALAGIVVGGMAWADSTTVGVSASVVGTCKFNNAGTIAFGSLDPSLDTLVNGTVTQPTFWCTRGASYSIADDIGLHESGTTFRMVHATDAAEFIPYTFTYTATGTGTGPANPLTMNIVATVPAGYSGALAGDYADTVTLTITP